MDGQNGPATGSRLSRDEEMIRYWGFACTEAGQQGLEAQGDPRALGVTWRHATGELKEAVRRCP